MSIQFDKSLETGNQLIDTQHKELIERVNRLSEECIPGTEKRTAVGTLDFLMDYTDFHFTAEEGLQREIGYPEYDSHYKEHLKFKKAVEDLRIMLEEEEGPTEEFVNAVKKNIEDWLKNHIRTWDTAVAKYARQVQGN